MFTTARSNICTLIVFLCFSFVPAARLVLSAQGPAEYQDAAKAALESQMGQEGKDCPEAKTQADLNVCIGQVREETQNDLSAFYQNLFALLAPVPANQEKLKAAEEQWLEYRAKSCEAISFLYTGGTIQGSAETSCEIRLTRSRMRDLDDLYETVLHH